MWKITVLVVLCLAFPGSARRGFGEGEQDWGFATVRPLAHMFWWLYYTTANVTDYTEKPLIIWLQGGPGGSSTGYGNFEELGPLNLNLTRREYTWVKDYNVIFIDNPVGSGFSYADSLEALPTTNTRIADDLIACMKAFLKKIPKFATVPTYIASESYGGKMAAEFAYRWYEAQERGEIQSNLKGVAMGDPWISPIDSVMSWAPYLLSMGIVDKNGFEEIEEAAKRTLAAINGEEWARADSELAHTEYLIDNLTNYINFYNVLYKVPPSSSFASAYAKTESRNQQLNQLMNGVVKKALGINAQWGYQRSELRNRLEIDHMKPVTDQVEHLLNETDINVIVYTAPLDLIVATPGTVSWVERLRWPNATEWMNSSQHPLVVDNVVEGYVKRKDRFGLYWISRSGHMVPTDNPAGMATVLEGLTSNAKN